MKIMKMFIEEVVIELVKEIPLILLIAIKSTLILLWVSTSIILIGETLTGVPDQNNANDPAAGNLLFSYPFALLKLCIAVLLLIPKTYKLGLILSFSFFGIYSLYIIYMQLYPTNLSWSYIQMFIDTKADGQIRFNFGAMAAIAIVLIFSKFGWIKKI